MSLSSLMTLGMMPTQDDFAECTGIGAWEEEWDKRIESMEKKKNARRQQGLGSTVGEKALQPAFAMMERPLQAQMYAATHVDRQSTQQQEQVEVEYSSSDGRKRREYRRKDEASNLGDPLGPDSAGADSSYEEAMKPKFRGHSNPGSQESELNL